MTDLFVGTFAGSVPEPTLRSRLIGAARPPITIEGERTLVDR